MPRRKENSNPPPLKVFADQLKKHRRAYKMSQAQLAGLAGTTQATVSAVESGKGNPSIGLLNVLATVFNCDVRLAIRRRPR